MAVAWLWSVDGVMEVDTMDKGNGWAVDGAQKKDLLAYYGLVPKSA
jgi:hypothetical protein